jgi:outer membrane protein assembly factor BamB
MTTRREQDKAGRVWLCAVAVAAFALAGDAGAQEWTRFRGPNGTGISHARDIPTKITETERQWKVKLPGSGHSSPVLWGERIFLTTTGDKSGGLSVLCLHAKEGRVLWQKDFDLKPFPRHQFNSYASSTPAVDGERVYVIWNQPENYMVTALDHEGKLQWQRDFGPFVSQHGCGVSPILYDGKVIIANEQDDSKLVKEHSRSGESFVVAVEAKTGKTVWQRPRRSAVVAYSTPCLLERRGQAALIFNSQAHGIYALHAGSGEVLWEFPGAFDKRSVSSPILAGDFILGSCGSGGGGNAVTAINASKASRDQKPDLAWRMKQSAPYVPTGIALGDRVWLWSDAGILSLVEAATGAVRYQERVGGSYFGSPIWIDDRLFCVSTAGELVVVDGGDMFKVLHRYSLGETCHSTPAVAIGKLFVRTQNHLWSFGGGVQVSAD